MSGNMDNLESEHPLFKSIVIRNIVNLWQPDVQAIKSFRLVCKTWYEETLQVWRSRSALVLLQEDVGCGMTIAEFEWRFRMGEVTTTFLRLSKIRYTRFILRRWSIEGETCGATESFWKLIQHEIDYLKLDHCSTKPSSFLWLLLRRATNLKHFVIFQLRPPTQTNPVNNNVIVIHKGEQNPNLETLEVDGILPPGIFWWRLLRRIPNLESIRSHRDHRKLPESHSLPEALRRLRKMNPNLREIKHFDAMIRSNAFTLDWESVESIKKCGLPLQSLCFELSSHPTTNNVSLLCRELIGHHGETLSTVKIFREPGRSVATMDKASLLGTGFVLEALQELHLYGAVTSNFRFLMVVPNLRRLVINTQCTAVEKWKFLEGVKTMAAGAASFRTWLMNTVDDANHRFPLGLYKLEQFESDLSIDPSTSTAIFRSIVEWMPNLRTLNAVLSNTHIPDVIRFFPKLRELSLLPCSSGVITDNEVIALAEGISNLRVFQLITYCTMERLGNRSVSEGFIKMRQLANLKICVSNQMTLDAVNVLRDAIPEVTIYRNYLEVDRYRSVCPHKNFCSRFIYLDDD